MYSQYITYNKYAFLAMCTRGMQQLLVPLQLTIAMEPSLALRLGIRVRF